MKPVIRYQSQLLFRKSYKPNRVIRIRPARSCTSRSALRAPVLKSKHYECKTTLNPSSPQMGARLKVREIPSRWRQGDRHVD